MARLLVLKTGALGDVLRTTSVLPGLKARDAELWVTWVTAPGARPLVESHPLVDEVRVVDPKDEAACAALGEALAGSSFDHVLSLDDERPLCALASRLARANPAARLSGAHLDAAGERVYSDDVAPWFDMGLLSRHGKAEADRRKLANTQSHPAIFAAMLGVEIGRPLLPLAPEVLERAEAFALAQELRGAGPVVGLNTGAGGRWPSKAMLEQEVVALTARLHDALGGGVTFLLLGGAPEAERNGRLVEGVRALRPALRLVDGGTDNDLPDFAARVGLCDVLVSSDSLALHVAVAREVPVVAFFAPTSAAEIELYGAGEKVLSTAPDFCTYRPDTDNRSITAERVGDAVLRVLGR